MPTARTTATDLKVGRRLRLLRTERKVSQTSVAIKLGLSFQQIQKYENGTNRISAGRLKEIAEYLAVPITYFFDGPKAATPQGKRVFEFIETANALQLLKAFSSIKGEGQRRALIQLAEEMGSGKTTPRSVRS